MQSPRLRVCFYPRDTYLLTSTENDIKFIELGEHAEES